MARPPLRSLIAVACSTLVVAAGCSSTPQSAPSPSDPPPDEAGSLVLYSGRDEELIQPIIDSFVTATGIEVEVRYGNSAEMAAQLFEEGDATPADVFYSQEVGAVGALAQRGALGDLPQATVDRVEERFRPAEGTKWVGVTARSRVIIYNDGQLDGAAPPQGALDLTDEQYRGKVAVVPGNAGFQAFITGFRASQGDAATEQWLRDMMANDIDISFEGNSDLLEAINRGDVPIGLTNHYYWARQEPAERELAQIVFPASTDPGGLVNATAAAVTPQGATNPAAVQLVDYLISEEGQQTFVEETWEYPVVAGIPAPSDIPPMADLRGPEIDLTDLDSLEATQEMLTREGYLS